MLGIISLIDWRRRMADLYAEVRAFSDPQDAWRHWRDGRLDLYRHHPQSPLPEPQRTDRAVPFYPYDPALRFIVPVEPVTEGQPRALPAGADGEVRVTPFGRTVGLAEPLGGEVLLYWIGGYGGGVFLPFLDATSGSETYGGGRYLLDGVKSADLGQDEDGRFILDFNFAYHPSCTHQPRWVCPLSPPDNRLPRPVRGGERL